MRRTFAGASQQLETYFCREVRACNPVIIPNNPTIKGDMGLRPYVRNQLKRSQIISGLSRVEAAASRDVVLLPTSMVSGCHSNNDDDVSLGNSSSNTCSCCQLPGDYC